ncbi:ATP-binding protein [Thiolapillus sp.]
MSIKPATILKLTLLGYILVAIPLTIGLLNTMLQVDRLAAQMQQAVFNSTQAVESGRLITTLALSMERSALQYLVLKDRNILSRYEKQREPFIQEIRRLLDLPADDILAQRLQQLQEHEARLHQKLLSVTNDSTHVEDRLAEKEQLSNPAASIPFDVTSLVSRESRRMNEQIGSVRQLLLWQAAALIPLALLIAVTFSVLISAPLRHLGAAIRQLGAGEFDTSIEVSGPQDIRELGEQLDWLRQQLAALNEQKLQFLQHVSHELKTPLTTIREGADLLQDGIAGALNSEQQEVVQILHSNSLQLQAQVETLLNFNLALAQEQPPERKIINIAELVTSVIDKHQLTLRSRNISVNTQLIPGPVNGDTTQLQTVIDNLLSNAIKFSPDGGEIQIGLRQQNQQLLLDVIDEGAGIPEEDETRLFEPFFQGKSLPKGSVSGTGLGLSLVKRHLHLHGGSIQLMDSTRGAHFQVTLPLATQANNKT